MEVIVVPPLAWDRDFHRWVEVEDVVDRYLLGRLRPLEMERFAEHYFGCARCVDQLERSRTLMLLVRQALAE